MRHAAKEVCRKMATRRSWKGFKKAGSYLNGVQKVTWMMQAWESVDVATLDVHVNSDWAKGPERKSTSGGMMMRNGTVVKHWSRTQATRALEYYAVITGAAEARGVQSMLLDLGVGAQVRV